LQSGQFKHPCKNFIPILLFVSFYFNFVESNIRNGSKVLLENENKVIKLGNMKYTKPENVKSPRGFVEIIRILCDKGDKSYSVAELIWCGKSRYGIRWNVSVNELKDKSKQESNKTCIGMPSSRGYSTWFVIILPEIWTTG